jgi:LSD1 subclass zinc finger protein
MSENVRVLKCPACGATLDPPQGQSSLKCSYCQSTVEIPAVAQVQAPTPAPLPYDPNIGKILALVRSGERIKAINMAREITGNTSLLDAAEIVDAIACGEEVEL